MPRLLCLFISTFFLCSGFAQTEEISPSRTSQRVQKLPQKSDEQVIEDEMQKLQDETQQAAAKLQEALGKEDMAALQKAMQEGDEAKVQELTNKLTKKLATGEGGAGLEKVVELSLKGFQSQTPDELRAELEMKIEGSLFAPIVKHFPKLLDLVVNLFQDKEALPKLFSIPKDRKKLLIFLGINIAIFIVSKIYKRMKKDKGGAISRWLFFSSLRFGVLFAFFHKELLPSLQVVKKTFF